MPRLLLAAVLLIAAVLASNAPAAAAKRVALVIGNSAYGVGPLANPKADATAVAGAFRSLGFDSVELKLDLGLDAMRAALAELSQAAHGADIAVVYFAGHGTERSGRNYLIPVDAVLKRSSDLELQAVALPTVIDQLGGAGKLRLIILDACRNNVFPLAGNTRSTPQGLARIEPDDNTLVVYAAKEGTTADDGAAREHSPFTEAFLRHLPTPDLEVNFVFRRIRDDVMRTTGRQQQPFVYGTMSGEPLYFAGTGTHAPPAGPPPPAASPLPAPRPPVQAEAPPSTALPLPPASPPKPQPQTALLAPPAGSAIPPRANDFAATLAKRRVWRTLSEKFPDWFQRAIAAASKEPTELMATKRMLASFVELRRANRDALLRAKTGRQSAIVSRYLDVIENLARISPDACNDYLGSGELSESFAARMSANDGGAAPLEIYMLTVAATISDADLEPIPVPAPDKADYDRLADRLMASGWKKADLRLFTDPQKLAGAPAMKVCQLFYSWTRAHLEVENQVTRARLIKEALAALAS